MPDTPKKPAKQEREPLPFDDALRRLLKAKPQHKPAPKSRKPKSGR